MELNKVFLIGNLTNDPEARWLQSGTPVTKMRIAVTRRMGKREGGERREETLFIDIEAWSRTAELCSQYLRKGSQVLVEGRLKMDQYQTQSGENRTRYLVVADRVQFGSRADGSSAPGGNNYQDRGSSRSGPPQRQGSRPDQQEYSEPAYDSDPSVGDDMGTEDDLPF